MIDCPTCNGVAWISLRGKLRPCGRCGGKGRISGEPGPARITPAKQFRIAIVGEAWGAEEARLGMPFVGASGNELNKMLEEADIDRNECFVTNVFNLQPQPTNDIKNLCTAKKLSSIPMPELAKGMYLQDQYYPEVERLWRELREVRPNLIIALGNTAMWALTGTYGIRKQRGAITAATLCDGMKVLPTYHPSAVLREWSLRSVVVVDLMKAKRQAAFPEIRRPARELWLEPSLNHIELFYNNYVLRGCSKLSFDIENIPGTKQITCIGFAPSPSRAIVIPFVDNRQRDGSYWRTLEEEKRAWEWVRIYMQTPEVEIQKIGQNTLYDINWLWSLLGFTPRNYTGDTMLKHHALQPEHEKGLGFLGSVYTDEPAWKLMRGRGKGTLKRGE